MRKLVQSSTGLAADSLTGSKHFARLALTLRHGVTLRQASTSVRRHLVQYYTIIAMLQPLLSHQDNGQQETLLQYISVNHDSPG